ncbi:MAG: hypothetical protein ACREHD_27435 [Pirellulales bacterium]
MPARWFISHFPACQFHVFLSHCDEDRQISRFVSDEKARGLEFARELDRDLLFRERIEARNQPGLIDRICARYPA